MCAEALWADSSVLDAHMLVRRTDREAKTGVLHELTTQSLDACYFVDPARRIITRSKRCKKCEQQSAACKRDVSFSTSVHIVGTAFTPRLRCTKIGLTKKQLPSYYKLSKNRPKVEMVEFMVLQEMEH